MLEYTVPYPRRPFHVDGMFILLKHTELHSGNSVNSAVTTLYMVCMKIVKTVYSNRDANELHLNIPLYII